MARNKTLQVFRGLKANLPSLYVGELGFCTDTKELYIGTANGNVLVSGNVPDATSSTKGGIKLGSDTVQTQSAQTPTSTSSRTYAVQKNSSGQAVVNVPWTDSNTTYSVMTQTEASTGTGTTGRLITPKVLADTVAAAIKNAGGGIVPNGSLKDMTWSQLSTISNAIKAGADPTYYFNVGDEIDMQLSTGEVITLQIYDFNHDDLANGSGKASITFGMKNLMTTPRQMNSTDTNGEGFTGSELYTWLQNDIYNSLPSDLRGIIKLVNKKTLANGQTTTIGTYAMKIFLFSEVEIQGTSSYSPAGEGVRYPIFTDKTSMIKKLSNSAYSANNWWTRSRSTSSSVSFCTGASGGGVVGWVMPTDKLGVCFGFCI